MFHAYQHHLDLLLVFLLQSLMSSLYPTNVNHCNCMFWSNWMDQVISFVQAIHIEISASKLRGLSDVLQYKCKSSTFPMMKTGITIWNQMKIITRQKILRDVHIKNIDSSIGKVLYDYEIDKIEGSVRCKNNLDNRLLTRDSDWSNQTSGLTDAMILFGSDDQRWICKSMVIYLVSWGNMRVNLWLWMNKMKP